jgi:hypothetical protein
MQKPLQLKVLVAVTGLETLAVAVTFALAVINIITGQEKSLSLMAALAAMIFCFVIWGVFITKGLWQLKPWSRASSVFWQTAQLAIAYESFQGETANASIGVALIIPSVVVLYLLFTKPVSPLLKRE